MKVIATYSEKRHESKREYQLFADHIRVLGTNFPSTDFETEIPLQAIRPEKEILKRRNATFRAGLWFLIGPFVLWTVLVKGIGADPYNEIIMLLWPIALVGVIMVGSAWKKEYFVTFRSDAGVPVLSIAKEGKEKGKFDGFIQTLIDQILAARLTKGEQGEVANSDSSPVVPASAPSE